MKKIIILFLITVCMSCESARVIGSQDEEYVITAIDPPKRMYLDLVRVRDGRTFKRVYVAKRCHKWKENVAVGQRIIVRTVVYQRGNQVWSDFDCSFLRQTCCK